MLVLNARLTVAPEARADVLTAIAALVAATRREPGCLGFACWEDPWSPGAFAVVGEWRDRDAIVDHERSAHVAAFKQDASALVRSRQPTLVYEVAAVHDLGAVVDGPPSPRVGRGV